MNPPDTVLGSLFFWLQGIRSASLTRWAAVLGREAQPRTDERAGTRLVGKQSTALQLSSWTAWLPTWPPYLLPSPHREHCFSSQAAPLASASVCQPGNVRQLAARGVIFPVYITGGSGLHLSFSSAFSCSASDVRAVKCRTFPTVRLVVSACSSPWGWGLCVRLLAL